MTEPELQHARRPHMDQFHAEQRAVNAACTRRTCTVAEAVSWESLSDKYPQVARLIAENDRIRDAAGQSVVNLELLAESEHRLSAFGARIVLEEAERLRAALTPPRT